MTKLELYNAALIHLGQDRVSSISQPGNLIKAMNEIYTAVAQAILRQYEWPEAIVRAEIVYDSGDTNNTDYDYVYEIPSGCLQIIDVDNDVTNEFIREGGYIYTDLYTEDDDTGDLSITLKYISDISASVVGEELVMNQMLCEVIALRLAIRIAPLADKIDSIPLLEQQYAVAMYQAQGLTATDRQNTPEDSPWWYDV